MSWLTVIWSMCSAACWVMALLHICLAVLGDERRTNLLLATIALGAGGVSISELVTMQTSDIETCRRILHATHIWLALLLVPIPLFIQCRFKTGRTWLGGLAALIWLAVPIIDFTQPNSLTFSEISGLARHSTFWGEPFRQIEGTRNPLSLIADLGVLLILAHVIDASIRLWRTGSRRRAISVGGSMCFFFIAAMAHVPLVDLGLLKIPTLIGPIFMPIVGAMSLELVISVVASSRLSRQVAANEARWRALLDNVRLVVAGTTPDGILSYANPHLCRLSGYSADELIGRRFTLLAPPENKEHAEQLFSTILAGTAPERYDTTMRTKSGEDLTVRWTNVLLRDEDDAISSTLSVGADITERLQTEQSLRETRRKLDHTRRLNTFGELSAALAHELNQPLAAILANAQAARRFMQADEPDLDEVRAILEDVIRDDKRAGEVIHRLRSLMRPGQPKIESFDVHDLIAETAALYHDEFASHNVALHLDLAAAETSIQTGRVELQQVLLNLLTNSLQAMSGSESRAITISTGDHDGSILVRVRDTGPGIPRQILPALFEPFSTSRSDGLGMGLAICRRLLQLHDSEISAANPADGGAEFTIRIPHQNPPST